MNASQTPSDLPATPADQAPRRGQGGRPAKPEGERRRKKYTVMATEAESREIERRAAAAGLVPGVYLRQAGLGARLSARLDEQALHELARIGVCVNQMARQAQASGQMPELDRLEEVIGLLRRAIRNL